MQKKSKSKNKSYLTVSAVLLSFILLLGAVLTVDVFADKDKLENLTIGYTGGLPVTITVTDKNDNTIFLGIISFDFEIIVIDKSDFDKNKFESKIFLTVDGTEVTEIHTSCSQPLFKEQPFGDFVIIDIVTEDENDSCGIDDDDDDKPKKSKECTRDLKNPWNIKPLCELFLLLSNLKDAITNNKDTYPPAGNDRFPSIVETEFAVPGAFSLELVDTPETIVQRSDPYEDASTGKWTIDIELVSMELTGIISDTGGDPLPIIIRESTTQQSLGKIQQQVGGGADFPADSFFDVFVEIEIEGIPPETGILQPLKNQDPFRISTDPTNPVQGIPPIGSEYNQDGCVDIFTSNDPPFVIAQLCDMRLIPTTPAQAIIKQEIIQLGTPTQESPDGEEPPSATPPDMASCEDGNACSTNDFFLDGQCQSGNEVSCDDNNVCTADSCDGFDGCSSVPVSCDDSNLCTFDGCDSINGCFNTPISCEDYNQCTVDSCDQVGGCSNEPVSCDDSVSCTVDSCDSRLGCSSVPDDFLCDDSDECTADSCDGVDGCSSEPLSCDDSNLCTVDSCDSQTGCSNEQVDCDDGLSCTQEACVGATGQCGGGILVNNCVIDNTCYANDDVNPANECEFCRADGTAGEDIRDWSDVADSTSCNGGSGICSSGVCI